jgi:hypothetical protein
MSTIGRVTQKDIRKANKKASREIELANQSGWTSKRKVHTSKKAYTRKTKHK